MEVLLCHSTVKNTECHSTKDAKLGTARNSGSSPTTKGSRVHTEPPPVCQQSPPNSARAPSTLLQSRREEQRSSRIQAPLALRPILYPEGSHEPSVPPTGIICCLLSHCGCSQNNDGTVGKILCSNFSAPHELGDPPRKGKS